MSASSGSPIRSYETDRADGGYYHPPTHSMQPTHGRLGGRLICGSKCRWCGATEWSDQPGVLPPELQEPCPGPRVPRGITFRTPPECQGQTVEVAYGGDGDCMYMRVVDRSDGTTLYYRGVIRLADWDWYYSWDAANGRPPIRCNVPCCVAPAEDRR